jgi:capsular exopolysaccharide synthesis family protein
MTSLPPKFEPGLSEFQASFDSEFEIRDLLRRLWGYKWLLASVIIIVVGGTWLVIQQIVPRYTATAVLLIEPPERNVIDLKDVVEGLDTHPQTIRSELIILQSRELSAKAVDKLGLIDTPKVLMASRGKSLFAHLNPLSYVPADWKAGVREFWHDTKTSFVGKPPTNGVELPQSGGEALEGDFLEARRNAVISRFLAGLSVTRDEFTRVVRISFTSENPKLAADAANALADVYVQNTLEVKYKGTREATEWLNKELDELRQRVDESEAAAERVRQGEALVQGRSTRLVSEEISSINKELLHARAETARLRVRIEQVEALRDSPKWTEQKGSILGSGMVQTLRSELFKLERTEADMGLVLGAKHPKMLNIRAEIADINQKLERELDKFIDTARIELQVAKAHEAALKRNLNVISNEVGELNEAEVQLRALEREAAANRSLYESFLARHKETSVQEGVQQADARIISYAQVPGWPSYPPKQKYMQVAFVVAIGLGLGLVFLLERLDKGFRTAQQVERLTKLPVLGLIPAINFKKEGARYPEDLITKDQHSRFTESINLLYSHIKWPRDGGPTKTLLISSPLPKDGKTSTAISLARRATLLGDRTLLIDLDFRHPQATRQLGLELSPGLAEIIERRAMPEDCLQTDWLTKTKFLSCGRGKQDPVALLGSESFRELLENLKEHFDLIVIDSSPILAVTEPEILARTVDQCLVLIRWGKTPRQAAATAVKQLQDVGARVVGTGLTQLDISKQSYYGYGDYGYYTKQMKGYYSQ